MVPLEVNLLAAFSVLQMGETGLAHTPQGDHAAGDGDIFREIAVVQGLQIAAAVSHPEVVGVGVKSPRAQLIEFFPALLADLIECPLRLCHR